MLMGLIFELYENDSMCSSSFKKSSDLDLGNSYEDFLLLGKCISSNASWLFSLLKVILIEAFSHPIKAVLVGGNVITSCITVPLSPP